MPHTRRWSGSRGKWIRGGSLQEVAATTVAGAIRDVSLAAPTAPVLRCRSTIPSRVREHRGDVALAYPAITDANPQEAAYLAARPPCTPCWLSIWWPRRGGSSARVGTPRRSDTPLAGAEPADTPTRHLLQISAVAGLGRFKETADTQRVNVEFNAAGDRGGRSHRGAGIDRRSTGLCGPAHIRAQRERNLHPPPSQLCWIGIGAGAAVLMVAPAASVVSRIFGDVSGGLNKDELASTHPPSGGRLLPGSVANCARSFPRRLCRQPRELTAIDGNPATSLKTDSYDPVPFPSFKNGVILMLQPPRPRRSPSTRPAIVPRWRSALGPRRRRQR